MEKNAIGIQRAGWLHNGGEAMNASANLSRLDDKEKEKMRNALLKYCKLDTLAMVRVWKRLREV